jgi:hypothetical protein
MAMADINLVMASVLTDSVARSILEQVANSRWLRFGDLITEGGAADVSREKAKATVRKLQDLHLIEVKPSGFEDLSTVFITANGLEANRKLGS